MNTFSSVSLSTGGLAPRWTLGALVALVRALFVERGYVRSGKHGGLRVAQNDPYMWACVCVVRPVGLMWRVVLGTLPPRWRRPRSATRQ